MGHAAQHTTSPVTSRAGEDAGVDAGAWRRPYAGRCATWANRGLANRLPQLRPRFAGSVWRARQWGFDPDAGGVHALQRWPTESHRRRRRSGARSPRRHPAPAPASGHRLTLGQRSRAHHRGEGAGWPPRIGAVGRRRVSTSWHASTHRSAPRPARASHCVERGSSALAGTAPPVDFSAPWSRPHTVSIASDKRACAPAIAIFAAARRGCASPRPASHAATASATRRFCVDAEGRGRVSRWGRRRWLRAPGTTRSRRSTRFRCCSADHPSGLSMVILCVLLPRGGRRVTALASVPQLDRLGLSAVILVASSLSADDDGVPSPRISRHLELIEPRVDSRRHTRHRPRDSRMAGRRRQSRAARRVASDPICSGGCFRGPMSARPSSRVVVDVLTKSPGPLPHRAVPRLEPPRREVRALARLDQRAHIIPDAEEAPHLGRT